MALANVCINLASRSSNEKRPGDRQPTPASNESQSLNIARSGRVSDNQRPRQALHATDSTKRTPSNKIRCLKNPLPKTNPWRSASSQTKTMRHMQFPRTCNPPRSACSQTKTRIVCNPPRSASSQHEAYDQPPGHAIPHVRRPHNTRPTISPQKTPITYIMHRNRMFSRALRLVRNSTR